MHKKMLAVDLDGTLLKNDQTISDINRQAVIDLINAGHIFVICSGRPPYRIKPIIDSLRLTNYPFYVSSYNGGRIYHNPSNEILYDTYMKEQTKNELIKFAADNGFYNLIYMDDGMRYDHIPEHLSFIKDFPMVTDLHSPENLYKLHHVHKVFYLGDAERITFAHDHMPEKLREKCSPFQSSPFYLEVMPKGVNKGKAVIKIAEILGVDLSDVYTMGDQENDIPMIEIVEHGIAVGNASDVLKAVASEVTLTNEENGVAEVIKKYFLND